MKKLISIILAVIMIISTCVCGLSVFAAGSCVGGHTVTSWKSNGKVNHIGTCQICGSTVKMAHELKERVRVDATCTEGGYVVYECSQPGCTYETEDEETFPLGHVVTKRHYNYDPNNDGVIDAGDDMFMQNSVNEWVAGPDGVDDYILTTYCSNGDCVTVEYKSRGNSNICKKCYGYTLLEKTVVEATCRQNGYTEYICSVPECGSYTDDFTPMADHDKFESEVVAPSCTGDGYTVLKCKFDGCTETEITNKLYALGHDFSIGTITYIYYPSSNSCYVTGKCTRCGNDEVGETLNNTAAEKCGVCDKAINKKTVTLNNCTEIGKALIECECGNYEIPVLPTGHVVDKTTYKYVDGKCIEVTDECIKCGTETLTAEADINKKEFASSTICIRCTSQIQKRVIVSPTCDRVGYTKVTCPECGPYTEATETKLNHDSLVAEWNFDHALGTMTFSATCDVEYGCGGYTFEGTIGSAAICSRCRRNSLTYKKTVHPTCISDGYTVEICSSCIGVDSEGNQTDSTYTYPIPATGKHDFVSRVVAPTCDNIGYTESTCKDCFYTVKTNKVAAIGHSGVAKNITYNRTEGTKLVAGDCSLCKKPYTQVLKIEPNENVCVYCGNATITKKMIKAPVCDIYGGGNGYINSYCGNPNCGKVGFEVLVASHTFGAWQTTKKATCAQRDENGNIIDSGDGTNPSDGSRERTCSSCGYVEKEIIRANQKHSYIIHTPGKDATCTEDGYATIRKCTICGELEGTVIADNGSVVAATIPATGHLLSPGTKNENFCVYCNSYLVTKYENGKAIVKTNENGEALYYLVDANGKYVYETDENGIRKIKETTSAKNGNVDNMPIYELIACDCMCHNVDGLAKFVVNILIFFCKLFGINQECACGALHYE